MTTESVEKPYKLYSTLSVMISSVYLFAGGYLIAINYHRTGEIKKRNITLLMTVLVNISQIIMSCLFLFLNSVLLITFAIMSCFTIIYVISIIYLLHVQLQGKMINNHIDKGGKMESNIKALLVLLLSIAVWVVLDNYISNLISPWNRYIP